MGNKRNSLSRKKAVAARKRERKRLSLDAKAKRTASKSSTKTLAIAEPTSGQVNPHKAVVQRMKTRKQRSEANLAKAARMKEMRATQTPLKSASPTPMVTHAPKTVQTSRIVTSQHRSNRPKFYNPRSNSKNAIYKRYRRSIRLIHPTFRDVARLILTGQIDNLPVKRLDDMESARLAVELDLPSRKYRGLVKRKIVVSERRKNKKRREIFRQSDYTPIDDPQKVSTGYWRSLRRTVEDLLVTANVNTLQTPIRVVIAADGGGKRVPSTKVVVHLADSLKPCSAITCGIYAVVIGKEKYDILDYVFRHLNEEITALEKNGIMYQGNHFFVSDLKLSCMALGLQGCAATYPCPFCFILLRELNTYDKSDPPELRTIDGILENAAKFWIEVDSKPTEAAITALRKACGSFSDDPLLTAVSLDYFAPPVLHICLGAVNVILEWLVEHDRTRSKALLDAASVTLVDGHKADLTGEYGAKLVNYVAKLPPEERQEPFMQAFAAVKPILEIAKIDGNYEGIDNAINNLIAKIKVIRNVTPKMHVLQYHVLPFIQRHGTWGRVSEQGVEALHKYFNKIVNKMNGRTNMARIVCFLTDHLIRNYPET